MFEIFHGRPGRESLIAHYLNVDSHQAVAASRSGFYRLALKELNFLVKRNPRVLLDVGCSFGHFMEMAAAGGWRVMGVDLLAEGVRASRQRGPSAAVFEGDLLEARFDPCSLHAVTMWDVLDQLEDPGAALESASVSWLREA